MDQLEQLQEQLERWKKLAIEAVKQTQAEMYGGERETHQEATPRTSDKG